MNNDNQHIPSGYKPSPLGIIPEDWEVKRLGDACDYVDYRGKSPNKSSNGVFLVTAKNIRDGYIDYDISKEFIPIDEFEETMRRGKAQIGDVLITTEAPLGHIAQIDNSNIALAQRVIKYRGKAGLRNTYLKYYLMSEGFQTILIANATGSTALGIKGSRLHQLPIIIPNQQEQDSIITVLELWDTAIAKQTALIEQLTLRKRGLMQQLLTGKKRLKGFEGEWKEVRLGDVCEITTGKLDANAMVNNGTYPFYTCAKETYRINEYAFDTEALLVSGNGEHVGYVHYYKGKFNAYQRTYVLDGFIENIFYMYYALNQYLPKRILQTKSNSNTPYIVMETLANMEILLPDDREQKVIAEILISADKEIEIQKQKLAALQEQKKGLMQVLLTGKRRIK